MKISQIKKKYFNFLNIGTNYSYKKIKCEICGSKKSTVIQEKISWGNEKFGNLPIVCCDYCGFLFQNPRFEKKFYKKFYREYYRKKIYSDKIPSKSFLQDQLNRGINIHKYLLKNYKIPKKGKFLDVGCSTGLMMKPFLKNGWDCYGNDPDEPYVKFGQDKLKLPIEYIDAEEMNYKKNFFDLILIAGSLEHCFDPNVVMEKCSQFAKKNSLLILEARGEPRSVSKYYFNHNHHRYFSLNSLELIMIKYGWEPIETTMYPISGPTREGGIWCIGRFKKKTLNKKFLELIKKGKKETFKTIVSKFNYYNYLNKDLNPFRGDYRNYKKK